MINLITTATVRSDIIGLMHINIFTNNYSLSGAIGKKINFSLYSQQIVRKLNFFWWTNFDLVKAINVTAGLKEIHVITI